jgi:two-component system, cell cycle sensor histidine kinase and response regulator CckA
MPPLSPPLRGAARVAAIYLVAGALWIVLSDRVLLAFIQDPTRITQLQTLKGWAFVVFSAVLVLGLSYRALRSQARASFTDRRLRAVLDTIPSRVAWRDREGRYLGGNAAFATDAGLPGPGEVRGRSDRELPLGARAAAVTEGWEEVLTSGRPFRAERVPVDSRDGGRRWLDASLVPLRDEGGGIEGVLLCYDDVTDRVDAELQLRRTQRLQEIGRLASGVVHDFRNVLAIIRGNADLLLDGGLVDGEVEEAVQDIHRATHAAEGVVRKLLGSSGRAPVSLQEVDVGDLVNGLAPMLSRLLRHTHPFRVEISADLPPVRCDAGAVEQMILNLVTNARDAMAPGSGEILLTATSHWTGNGPPEVVISVSDEGSGIPRDVLPRIFEPFFTTKPEGQGTGLGLPMVKGLMDQHGGQVEVESREGLGTTVHLRFPALEEGAGTRPPGEEVRTRAAAARDGAGSGPPEGPSGGNRTILVVEDQPDLRRTLQRVLRRSGYRVVEAPDGPSALEAARENRERIDLVLSDLALPGFGGMELYRQLRAEGILAPFVITTGQDDLQEVARNEDELQLPVIRKPWTVGELAVELSRVLDGHGA